MIGILTAACLASITVIDGDTFRNCDGQTIRIAGLDAPEYFKPACPQEWKKAERSKLFLDAALTSGREIRIIDTGNRSYERIVAHLMLDTSFYTDIAVQNGHGRFWNPKEKYDWCTGELRLRDQ
jgi:endonuclease YncB( thermonuclease family)